MLNHQHRTRLQLCGSRSPLATIALPGAPGNDNEPRPRSGRHPYVLPTVALDLPWRAWSDLAAPVITANLDLAASAGRLAVGGALVAAASMWRSGVGVALAGTTVSLAVLGIGPPRGQGCDRDASFPNRLEESTASR